jgi:hypothetical protein
MPIEKIWLAQEFDKLHDEHLLILKKIDDIQTGISPALEQEVTRALALAKLIDRKVPDLSRKHKTN